MGRIVAICFFAALATVTARSAFSQNAGDMINLFGAMMRAAIVDHARTEWSKISPDQSSCIEEALQQQGYSVGVMIQNGIAPTDPRMSPDRAGCRRSTVASSPPSANDVDIQNLSSTPTFDCAKGRTLTAHIICLDRVGASADWDLTSAYWARYFSLGQDDRHAFEQAQERWLDGLNQVCRRSQNQRECVLAAYRKRAAGYRSQLDGDAVAEAHLSPEQHAQIQQSLIAQGFMDDKPDGEFGAITRSAIGKFKSDVGAPEGEFLTTQQRDQLLRGKSPTNGTIGSSGEISDKASRLSPAEAAAQCQSQNTESRLIGCTAIIDAKARGIASSVALPDAFDGRCWAYIDLENYERALADCRAAISLAPRHPYAYNNLGYAFLGLQDFTNAINAYTKSIELKPNFIFSHLGRAKAYVQSGNMELARRDFQYVLAVESTNQQALDGIAALDNPTSASDTGPKPKPLGSVAPAKETPRLRDARSFLNDAKRFIADQNSAPATLSGIANEAALLQIALDKFDEPAAVQSTQRLAALLKPIPGFEQFEQQQQATRERESARILVEARILADQNTFFINDYMKGHLGDSSTSSLNKLRDQIGTSLKKNTIEEINGANDAVKEYIAQNGLSEPYEISTRQFSQPSAPATESTKSLAGRLGLTESSDFIVKGPQDDIILLYNASATAPHVWRNVRGDIVFQNEAASLCFARAPDVAVERYIDHVLGDRGAKTLSSLATPCDLAKAETRVDVIAFQRGEFSKSREDYILSLAKLVEAGGFRKYEIITDYAAVFEQRKILSRQIETEVESNARGGFGVIALGGSPLACVIPPEGAERVDGLKELLRRNIDVIAPTAISDWQTVDTAN